MKKTSKLQFHVSQNRKLEQDYQSLSDDFLLKNIDLSYAKSFNLIKNGLISEHSFANYVLPYKVNASGPHEWRNKSLSLYTITEKQRNLCLNTDSMRSLATDIDKYVKNLIKYKLDTVNENLLTLDGILKRGSGSCLSFCDLNSYIARANGLPITFDYVPAWGNLDGGHSWNVLVPNQQESYPISWPDSKDDSYHPLTFLNSSKKGIFSSRIPPKVYRRGFIPDTSSVYLKYYKELSNIGISFTDLDITSKYINTINFNVKPIFRKPAEILLLNVFNFGTWTPVSAIGTTTKNYEFRDIGVENLYLISSLDYIHF